MIDHVDIECAVCGFGDSPGNAALSRVFHLALQCCGAGVLQQRISETPCEQQRHKVLEHSPAPGEQDLPVRGRIRASQCQPVVYRYLAFSNGHQAGETGLACEQIVVGRKRQRRTHLIPDGKEPAIGIIEELHIHRCGESFNSLSESSGAHKQIFRRCTDLRELGCEIRHPGPEVRRQRFFTAAIRCNVRQHVRSSLR